MPPFPITNRRGFLRATSGVIAAGTMNLGAVERPPVVRPRATDGDSRHEPDWENRFEISVGTSQADLVGSDDKVLQAAVDYVTRMGGGTVRVKPGTYTLRNSVYLASDIRILGSGEDTILNKIPSDTVDLAEDSDWYDQEITLADGSAFRVGDGVALVGKDPDLGRQVVIKRTLVAQSGNRFKLNDGLRENLWLAGKPTCASLFPLLTSEHTQDVVIENIVLDGNRENNENFNGNYGGCIFLQDCNRYTIRTVTTRNYNGDGISFQICHDVVVEECHSHDNQDLGVHPGSGSQRPLILNNRIERNGIGLFWCWGVKYGLAEGNRIDSAREYGISIGHNDTDNVMRKNEVLNSGKVGILFRDESRGVDFWPNRNVVEDNRIVDSGGDDGIAIDIQGKTREILLARNSIIETRGPADRIGVRIGKQTSAIQLESNSLSGFAVDVLDERST